MFVSGKIHSSTCFSTFMPADSNHIHAAGQLFHPIVEHDKGHKCANNANFHADSHHFDHNDSGAEEKKHHDSTAAVSLLQDHSPHKPVQLQTLPSLVDLFRRRLPLLAAGKGNFIVNENMPPVGIHQLPIIRRLPFLFKSFRASPQRIFEVGNIERTIIDRGENSPPIIKSSLKEQMFEIQPDGHVKKLMEFHINKSTQQIPIELASSKAFNVNSNDLSSEENADSHSLNHHSHGHHHHKTHHKHHHSNLTAKLLENAQDADHSINISNHQISKEPFHSTALKESEFASGMSSSTIKAAEENMKSFLGKSSSAEDSSAIFNIFHHQFDKDDIKRIAIGSGAIFGLFLFFIIITKLLYKLKTDSRGHSYSSNKEYRQLLQVEINNSKMAGTNMNNDNQNQTIRDEGEIDV